MIGTLGSGVWHGVLDPIGGVEGERPHDIISQVLPLPANDHARVVLDLPRSSHIILELFSSAGEQVLGPSERDLAAGTHALELDLSTLPAGVYIYRITAGGTSTSGRIVKR